MFIDPYIGNITVFAGNFAPLSWAFCQGQSVAISSNTTLFALIGTTYGGDGQNTFNLPDFRSRVAIHMGQGPGLSNYILGQASGNENVSIGTAQMPGHSHPVISLTGTLQGSTTAGSTSNMSNAVPATVSIYSNQPDGGQLNPTTATGVTVPNGSGQPISIIQPVLAMNYIIATEGIFPSRN